MRKWLIPLFVIASMLIAAVPAAADDGGIPAPPTIVLSEDGTTGYSTIVEGWWVSAVYAEYCNGREPYYVELGELGPITHFGWYTDWEAGEGPLSLLAGWVSYWDEEEWSNSQWISATRECTAEPELQPLVMEYVYYSATGFFGDRVPGPYATNTLTLWSIQGEPTVPRRAFWAGGSLPDDYRLACSDWLYDDGAGGVFSCDAFLSSVGERRALLRDDSEGLDVLEPILRYLSWAAPE